MNSLRFNLGFADENGHLIPYKPILYAQQAALVLNACPDPELRKRQDLTLIWFDIYINFNSDQTQQLRKRLHTLNCYVLFYSDINALSHYLEGSQSEKIIIILVQDSASVFSPKWKDEKHINRFYLTDADQLNSLLQEVDDCITEIFHQRRVSGQLVLDTSLNSSLRDVRNESFAILYYRMYKQILLNHDQCSNEKAKSELLKLCRNHYKKPPGDINDFEQNYRSDDAIRWYTNDSFVYRLINRALRTQDLDCLYVLQFYLRDLSQCLKNDWQIWRDWFDPGYVVDLYRGQTLPRSIRYELEKSIGQTISINGYWSTSRTEKIARTFASIGVQLQVLDHESILFEIHVDLHGTKQVFADISHYSKIPNEEEVLFDLDATFRIESVMKEEENEIPYWRVRMTLASDHGQASIQQSIEQRQLYDSTGFDQVWSMRADINPFDIILRLNNVVNYLHQLECATLELPSVIQVKQDDAAFRNYIQGCQLILSVPRQTPESLELQKILCQGIMHLLLAEHLFQFDDQHEWIRWPQRALGLVHFKGGNYPYAIKQWTRLLNENAPHNRFDTVVCCFYLGLSYSKMRQYATAIEFFERALMYVDGLPRIFEAQCYMQIGHAIELQGRNIPESFRLARLEYEKALNLYENHISPTDEVALALCYAVIGNSCFIESAWSDESHRYFLKAIDVYDALFPTVSPSADFMQQVCFLIVGVLFHIALHYYRQLHRIDQAQVHFQRIITYHIEHCPFDSYALAQRYLGEIFFHHHQQYDQALKYFQASLQFYETYTPEDYWELALAHLWLAKTYVKHDINQNALDHATRALDFLIESDPLKSLVTLPGSDLSYLKRVTSFEQQDNVASRKHTKSETLSKTYRLLGDIYERMQEIDRPLAMYACALDINQHFTPIYQIETVITENRLSNLYRKINERDEAMVHYKNALNRLKTLYREMYG